MSWFERPSDELVGRVAAFAHKLPIETAKRREARAGGVRDIGGAAERHPSRP